MYNRTAQTRTTGRYMGGSGFETRRRSQSVGPRGEEQKLLLQLLVCVALFLTVFVGKGIFPGKLVQVRDNMHTLITANTDFRSAFGQLGASLADSQSVLGELGAFCMEVFGVEETPAQDVLAVDPLSLHGILAGETPYLMENPSPNALAQQMSLQTPLPSASIPEEVQEEPAPLPQEEVPVAVPAAGTVLLKSDYDGKPLPENYTLDHIALGQMETATPVLGNINSDYAYRDHPINGKYQFHGGLDIGGQKGDPIVAFAAGTVEYVGEDTSYGLYLQLDHGNGVKSFYAHCQSITVKKGQTVSVGEKIATVGSSGTATGPHLHLEIKYNGTNLNPLYYIDTLPGQ